MPQGDAHLHENEDVDLQALFYTPEPEAQTPAQAPDDADAEAAAPEPTLQTAADDQLSDQWDALSSLADDQETAEPAAEHPHVLPHQPVPQKPLGVDDLLDRHKSTGSAFNDGDNVGSHKQPKPVFDTAAMDAGPETSLEDLASMLQSQNPGQPEAAGAEETPDAPELPAAPETEPGPPTLDAGPVLDATAPPTMAKVFEEPEEEPLFANLKMEDFMDEAEMEPLLPALPELTPTEPSAAAPVPAADATEEDDGEDMGDWADMDMEFALPSDFEADTFGLEEAAEPVMEQAEPTVIDAPPQPEPEPQPEPLSLTLDESDFSFDADDLAALMTEPDDPAPLAQSVHPQLADLPLALQFDGLFDEAEPVVIDLPREDAVEAHDPELAILFGDMGADFADMQQDLQTVEARMAETLAAQPVDDSLDFAFEYEGPPQPAAAEAPESLVHRDDPNQAQVLPLFRRNQPDAAGSVGPVPARPARVAPPLRPGHRAAGHYYERRAGHSQHQF